MEYERHDLARNPPSRELLSRLIDEYGLDQVMNRRSPSFKARGLDSSTLSAKKAIELMLDDVNLIRRPLVVRGKKAIFGYDEEAYGELGRA